MKQMPNTMKQIAVRVAASALLIPSAARARTRGEALLPREQPRKDVAPSLWTGVEAVVRRIMAPGFAFPEKYANLPGTCLFSPSELPAGGAIRFIVTPRDCFGGRGRSLVVEWKMP